MTEIHQIRTPSIGEGVHYVKVARILKNIGDWVEEDSDILEIETDKATMGIPATESGVIKKIYYKTGDTANVGDVLVELSTLAIEKQIPTIEAHRRDRATKNLGNASQKTPHNSSETPIADTQTALIKHMRRSKEHIISASIQRCINWETIDSIRKEIRRSGKNIVPSSQEIIVWSVAQAMFKLEKFRSKILSDEHFTTYNEISIGIAVSEENDSLQTPTVEVSTNLNFADFLSKFRIDLHKEVSKGTEYHSVSVSDMSPFGVTWAQPVVVYPSIATLFIGTPYWKQKNKNEIDRCCNLVLSFDHRLINGVYAAKFLREIEINIKRLSLNILEENK